jgi:hypothetical protein
MSQEEIEKNGYTLEGWSIMRGGEIIGNVTSVEWELYDGVRLRTLSNMSTPNFQSLRLK